ncbi:MAG: ATP synthase F1 subunit delta [Rhodospirillales bacterium 20-58-10]|nr:MAG: ATP synthase F1 subunit delta [Rhodospirillales bacterium 20-58-10]
MLSKNTKATKLVEISTTGETGFSARYAAALYALAFEQNVLDKVVDEMASLGRLMTESSQLSRLVRTPFTDTLTRNILNNALAAQGFSTIVLNFVNVAVTNRRLHDLPALVAGFAAYVANKRGEVVANVATATPLSDLQRTQLRARLTEAGYGSVKLFEHTDPELLGGMTLKIGTKLYDTSLKSRLNRLNYSLKGAI